METMERMLAIWIEECNQNDTNVTLNDIKKKAVLPTYLDIPLKNLICLVKDR